MLRAARTYKNDPMLQPGPLRIIFCSRASLRHSSTVHSMAQEAPEAPTGSRSSSVSTPCIRESRHAQMHAPFPSWSPYAAGAFVGVAEPAALADPSECAYGDPWMHSAPDSGGAHGFLSLLEARNVTPEIFEDVPAADDSLTGLGAAAAASAAAGNTASYGLASVDGRYTGPYNASAIKPEIAASPLTCLEDGMVHGCTGCVPCCDHGVKRDNGQLELVGASMAAFLPEMIPSSVQKQSCLRYSFTVGSSEGLETETCAARSLSIVPGSFSHYRSIEDKFMPSNRQEQPIPPEIANGGSGSGAASVTTRRKSEEWAGGNTKKPRKEASETSPPKTIQPQVNLGEKITALQQIVSPFGKIQILSTDRASVLSETIKCIKFLHDQIQLFSEPYMTKSLHKSGVEEKTGTPHDLRSTGLCLVPVSWASQVCRDDTQQDCWTPAYRSCLHQ